MNRKLAFISTIVAAIAIVPAKSWAFQSKGKAGPFTATTTTSGTKSAALGTVDLRSAADPINLPAANGQIQWSNVNPGADTYKIADGVIRMSGWSVTDGNGGI